MAKEPWVTRDPKEMVRRRAQGAGPMSERLPLMNAFDLRDWTSYPGTAEPAIIDQVVIHSQHISSSHALFVALEGDQTDGHRFLAKAARNGARYALVRTDCPDHEGITLLRVDDPLQALQSLASDYRRKLKAQIVAVTGSYGKTVTKDLLATLLESHCSVARSPESFNSQLGVALSLLGIKSDDAIAIIEAGVSQPGEMERLAAMIQPDHALLTTVGPAHLRTMGSLDVIAREKAKLLAAVPTSGFVITPDTQPSHDHPRAESDPDRPGEFHLFFPDGDTLSFRWQRTLPKIVPLLNQALRAAWLLGAPKESIIAGLERHLPEPMRTEVWRAPQGTTFINDCYCADPLSIDGAVRLLATTPSMGRKLFLFGGLVDRRPLPLDLPPDIEEIRFEGNRRETMRQLRERCDGNSVVLLKGAKRESLEELRADLSEGIGDSRLCVKMDSVRQNLDVLRQHIGLETDVMAMLKADGYGAGVIPLARLLGQLGVKQFGVAHVAEAVQLRLAGVQETLFVFAAAPYEADQIVKWDLQVGASELGLIHALDREATRLQRKVGVHLHIDTGMTRFGCRPEEAGTLAIAISQSPYLELAGVFSHYACADDPKQDRFTRRQTALFTKAVSSLREQGYPFQWTHLANSSGAIRIRPPGCNLVRVGLSLLGLHASPDVARSLALEPAMALTSRIAMIHTCARGEWVGYGKKHRIRRDGTSIGVVPLGHSDGIRRALADRGEVLVQGKRVPIVGEICMDYFMVDLSDVEAKVEDTVVLFGEDESGAQLPAEEVARRANLSIYELITGLGPRIQRVYAYDGEARESLFRQHIVGPITDSLFSRCSLSKIDPM